MLKFLLCHIHFIQSYYNNGAIFSVYWLGAQTKIFPSSWFCLKEALITCVELPFVIPRESLMQDTSAENENGSWLKTLRRLDRLKSWNVMSKKYFP